VPEGHTILRTATSLGRWLEGRQITAARATVQGVPAHKLVGQTVQQVEAKGKHLLVRFDSGMVLHTHMRMTGAWHLYNAGDRWQKPAHLARVVLEAGDRAAVCFSAPVVELLAPRGEELHPALTRLGPDVLADPGPDLAEVRRRLAAKAPTVTIGEALLDQQVVAGIGNIFRSEALFACRVAPQTPASALDPAEVDEVVLAAARLLRAAANRRGAPYRVYNKAGRPCPRCGTPISAAKLGQLPRTAYWCPTCQESRLK
jgi:endonuclease-8